jgi:hypothetical protein
MNFKTMLIIGLTPGLPTNLSQIFQVTHVKVFALISDFIHGCISNAAEKIKTNFLKQPIL